LEDGVAAIAHHAGRGTFGGGHELVVDHQQAVVQAFDLFFHHYTAADLLGQGQGNFGFFEVLDADGGTTAVVAADRLDHARKAHRLQRGHEAFLGAHHAAFGHGDFVALQQLLGLFFVAGDLHADVAGAGW
jgi:hypothetical protein